MLGRINQILYQEVHHHSLKNLIPSTKMIMDHKQVKILTLKIYNRKILAIWNKQKLSKQAKKVF